MSTPRARPGRTGRPTDISMGMKSMSALQSRVNVPPEPTAEDKDLKDAQQLARVELLMLKGVRKAHLIKEMLNLDSIRQVERMIERVKARWEIIGGGRDIKAHRGEALARIDLVESEAWVTLGNLDDKTSPGHKGQFLKLIAELQTQRNDLLGLTPKVIERLALLPDNTNEIVARLSAQGAVAGMAGRLLEIIAERRQKMGLPPAQTISGQVIVPRSREAAEADVIEDAEA